MQPFESETTLDAIEANAPGRSSWRWQYREYLGEFLSTYIMLTIGIGIVMQLTLVHPNLPGGFGIGWLTWGLAVMCGIYVAGGISGAHMNPSVTLALAVHGRFPLRKVPGFILAQVAAAFVTAAVLYALYYAEFQTMDPFRTVTGANATSVAFYTNPTKGRSIWQDFFGEAFATMLLLIVIFASGVADNNAKPINGLGALVVGLTLVGVGMATGEYALNPARDIGPRIFTSMVYGGGVFTVGGFYFIVPWIAPFVGAVLGGFIHDTFCAY